MTKVIKDLFDSCGIPSMNSELFIAENHNDNNSIILHFEDLIFGHSMMGVRGIVGYTSHPSFLECNGYGIMFLTYDETYYWCHMSEELLNTIAETYRLKSEIP